MVLYMTPLVISLVRYCGLGNCEDERVSRLFDI